MLVSHCLVARATGARVGADKRDQTVMSDHDKKPSPAEGNKLSDVDQARVDEFLQRGVNAVERKPFRPLFLILLLVAVVAGFSLLSQGIAQWAGIY